MTITKKRLWLVVLVVTLVACLATAGMLTAFAVTAIDTIQYPFRTGGGAYANAPTWAGVTSQSDGDDFQYLEVKFPSTNFTDVDYVAFQIKANAGNPGFTFGVIGNGGRCGTYVDKTSSAYFVSSNGSVRAIDTLYSSINIGANADGMLLVPMSSLSWVSWAPDTKDLAKTTAIYIETNGRYNWGFEFVLGEVGYYKGDPANGGEFTKLLDLSTEEKSTAYYLGNASTKLTFPSELEVVDPVPETTITYPFATGDLAFKGAMQWTGPTSGYVPEESESADNWQTFKVQFDNGAADLTNATYIAVQYQAKSGAPGLTYGLTNSDARYSISGHDGDKVYIFNEEGTCASEIKIQYGAANVSSSGMLLIPMDSMGWQFGSAANKSLSAITEILFTTNSKYNWNYEVVIGEVGYYTGELSDNNFTKLVSLSAGSNPNNYIVTSDVARQCGTMSVVKIDQMVYGDVTLNWTATGKTGGYLDDTCVSLVEKTDNSGNPVLDDKGQPVMEKRIDQSHLGSFAIWDGGSYGKTEMVTDSYGDDAVKLTCLGPNPDGDKYTATTIADGIRWQWAGQKGVTLWARNDSDIEVSFNLEMDVVNPAYKHTNDNGHNARYNIKQGGRFWLYDVNTGKQTIYMTRPCVTLPVGFEGWVRIPFECFYQADWSVNGQGVMARSLFIDEEGEMAENSYVSYVAITVFSGDYTNKSFSINKVGSYAESPRFNSAFLNNESKTIPTLMELPALPQSTEEVK